MAQTDSVDKIVGSYFALVATKPFTYKGKHYVPKKFKISPLLFRGYTCPRGCGGCCPRFSLDYLPSEKAIKKVGAIERQVNFNGVSITIYSDTQNEHKNHSCKHLNQKDGRCGIHKYRPFSCDFELIRPMIFKDEKRENILTQKLFGRGWQMLRIDKDRGALCEMTPITTESVDDVIRKVKKLQEWCSHFRLENDCVRIIEFAEQYKKQINNKFF